jgi:hypothetical protein
MATLIQGLRYGLQTFLKSPNYTLIAVFMLALGVCANKPGMAQADKVDGYIPSGAIKQLSNKIGMAVALIYLLKDAKWIELG